MRATEGQAIELEPLREGTLAFDERFAELRPRLVAIILTQPTRRYPAMGSTAWGLGMDGEATRGRDADERAFDALAARELAGGYRTALLLLGDAAEAEDAVQDALLRAWQRWDQLRDPGRAGAWFGRILLNACRDRLRSPRREVRWTGDARAADGMSAFAEREALGAAMHSMNIDQRIVLVLRFYLDLSVEEIAARTGAPEATVRSRLRLALGEHLSSVYVGNVSASLVRVGELFRDAVRLDASGVVLVHNHPSGDPTPSPDDLHLTAEAIAAGRLLDVDVLDHVVIGHDAWVSLRDRGVSFDRAAPGRAA